MNLFIYSPSSLRWWWGLFFFTSLSISSVKLVRLLPLIRMQNVSTLSPIACFRSESQKYITRPNFLVQLLVHCLISTDLSLRLLPHLHHLYSAISYWPSIIRYLLLHISYVLRLSLARYLLIHILKFASLVHSTLQIQYTHKPCQTKQVYTIIPPAPRLVHPLPTPPNMHEHLQQHNQWTNVQWII